MEIKKIIHYGFGKDYLKNWGIKEALREIYQNFLDYGDYNEEHELALNNDKIVQVTISNDWMPDNLEFLRVGNSKKNNANSIGKHGEGLKMAFLILLREGYLSKIITPKYIIQPAFYTDAEIGECFCFNYETHYNKEITKFTIQFECDFSTWNNFDSGIIKPEDKLFTHGDFGDIVDRKQGDIYSGGLFVGNFNNISRAYNILPSLLPLDRDRTLPRAFDVNWSTSKMNDAYGKWTTNDLSYSDTLYLDNIPEEVKKDIKVKSVGNSIQFTYKDDSGTDKILNNSYVTDKLKEDNFFQKIIKKIKLSIAKKLGLYDLLMEFKNKHLLFDEEAIADFEIIMSKVKK